MGGGSKKESSVQTVQATLPPELMDAWRSVNADVTDFAKRPVTPYNGMFSAPANDTFNAATTGITNALKAGPSANYTAGTQALTRNLGFTPSQVQAGNVTAGNVTASNVNAPTVGSTTGQASLIDPGSVGRVGAQDVTAGNVKDVSGYMNPYENTVVGNTLSDIQRQKDIALNGARARAGAAGAFGGSRSAILESETGRSFDDAMARTAAELRQGGYAQAQTVAGQDASRALQASLANQGRDLTASQANMGRDLSIAGANQGAQNDMTRTNLGFTNAAQQAQAGYDFNAATGNADRALTAGTTNAANALTASTGNANRDLAAQQGNQSAGQAAAALQSSAAGQLIGADATTRAQDGQFLQMLQSQGMNLQNMQNQDLAGKYAEFLRQQQVPYDQINLRLSALGLNPSSNDKTITGNTTTKSNPGLFGWAGLLG